MVKILEKFKSKFKILEFRNLKSKSKNKDKQNLDYEINIKRLKRKLNIRLLGGIVGILVVLLMIFTMMSIRHMEKYLKEDFLGRLEHSREERKKSIQDYYKQLELEMERKMKSSVNLDVNLEANKIRLINKEEMKNYENLGVEEMALFTSDYKVIYKSQDRDLIEIKKEIKALKFSKPLYVEKINVSEDISSQHVFYKMNIPQKGERVLYFRLNNKPLEKILKVSLFNADILNDEFYITASNRVRESTEYTIDEISKKILDGRVGVDVFNGKIYSYTYIDIGENPLYLKVYENVDRYEAPLNRYKNKIKLLWIISIVISITSVFFINLSIDSYMQGIVRINIEKEGDKKYKFLKSELVEVFEGLDDVDKILGDLKSFTQKLKIIGKRVKNQNKETLEEKKAKEELIEKIRKDKKLREVLDKD